MRSSPLTAATWRPSSVNVNRSAPISWWGSWSCMSVKGAPPLFDVHQELVAEHADARADGRGEGRAEHADRRLLRRPGHAGGDVVAQVHEEVQIFLAPCAVLNSVHDALEPARALATGRALAARLTREELGDAPRRAHHAGRRVHDDDRARAEHGARIAHLVLPEREVHLVRA